MLIAGPTKFLCGLAPRDLHHLIRILAHGHLYSLTFIAFLTVLVSNFGQAVPIELDKIFRNVKNLQIRFVHPLGFLTTYGSRNPFPSIDQGSHWDPDLGSIFVHLGFK